MEKKISQYANGFSFLLSKEGGEAVITFTQNQPQYNEETGKFEKESGREVTTVILPYKLLRGFCGSLENALEREEAKKPKPTM